MAISYWGPSGVMVFHSPELVIPFLALDMLKLVVCQIPHVSLEITLPDAEFCYHLGHGTE